MAIMLVHRACDRWTMISWTNSCCVFILFVSILLCSSVQAEEACNPQVSIGIEQKTLSQALVYLADSNEFSLSFPKALDQELEMADTMLLNAMVRYLTRDLNTMLSYSDKSVCEGKKLRELIVLPTGEDTEFVTVKGHSATVAEKQPKQDYLRIDDMNEYVTEVMENGKKANRNMMTPEQRAEFNRAKRDWKKKSK